MHTSCLKICNGQTAVPNYIHIYFHRALYLIVQCIFGWDWSITKLITSEFFFIKWIQFFFIKSTKIGVFYQYGYIDITKNRDPCHLWKLETDIRKRLSLIESPKCRGTNCFEPPLCFPWVPIWSGVGTFSQALRPPDGFVLQLRTLATTSNVAASIEEKYNSRKIVIEKKFRSYEVKWG